MATTRRIIEIYLDVDNSRQVSSGNGVLTSSDRLTLYRQTQTLIRCHLRRADGATYFDPPAGVTWFFGIDNSYDSTNPDPVITQDADFNIASDWTDLDETGGKITWRINTATTQLATAMGTNEKLNNAKAELWMTPPGVNSTLLCQWPINMLNIVTEIASDTTLEYLSSSIVTQDATLNTVTIWYPDGTEAQIFSKT